MEKCILCARTYFWELNLLLLSTVFNTILCVFICVAVFHGICEAVFRVFLRANISGVFPCQNFMVFAWKYFMVLVWQYFMVFVWEFFVVFVWQYFMVLGNLTCSRAELSAFQEITGSPTYLKKQKSLFVLSYLNVFSFDGQNW